MRLRIYSLAIIALVLLFGVGTASAKTLQQETVVATPKAQTWSTKAGGNRTVYIFVYCQGKELKERIDPSGEAATYYGHGVFVRARIKGHTLVFRYVGLSNPRKITFRLTDSL